MTDKMREEFEAWALERLINSETMRPLERDPEEPKEYRYSMVNMAWLAWQASREALVIELPEPFAYVGDYAACGGRRILVSAENTGLMCRKIPVYDRAAIEAAGLKVKP